MQSEKSQLQNREAGMRVLRARILAHRAGADRRRELGPAEVADPHHGPFRADPDLDYPENRIADHRTGYKAYNLDQVMNGDPEPVIQSAIEMDEQARLDAIGD